jgi:hypothetical protein
MNRGVVNMLGSMASASSFGVDPRAVGLKLSCVVRPNVGRHKKREGVWEAVAELMGMFGTNLGEECRSLG